MSEAIIELKNLTKSYGSGFFGRRQAAVTDLTVSVPRGCIYGFLGANGAGKTTCIKVLMGLQFADAGEARVFGLDPLDPVAKQRIGFLPERPYFHDAMTAHDFLNFHRRLFGTLRANAKPLSNEELLALVGLSGVGKKPLRGYSKGMLQRAGIAQALVNDPELVVFDEPMSGLDPVGRREVRDLLLKLNSLGKTIFFSTHILTDVEEVCHRIAFLEKGRLRHEGPLHELLAGEGRGVEVTLTGLRDDFTTRHKPVRQAGDLAVFRCANAEEAKALVTEAWAAGATLVNQHREQRSLEDFLFGEGKGV